VTLPSKQKWISLTILAIIIPTGLLTAFKLTGIIPEASEPKIITLEPASWTMEQPSKYTVIGDCIEKSYVNDETAIFFRIFVSSYHENSIDSPFEGRDGIIFRASVNESSMKGFVSSLIVKFQPDSNSTVFVSRYTFLEVTNITITEMREVGTYFNEAYLKASPSESSSYLKTQIYWVFMGDNNIEHKLDLKLEVIYFNGNEYRKIIAPIVLQALISA
jgi:hypothetical protein